MTLEENLKILDDKARKLIDIVSDMPCIDNEICANVGDSIPLLSRYKTEKSNFLENLDFARKMLKQLELQPYNILVYINQIELYFSSDILGRGFKAIITAPYEFTLMFPEGAIKRECIIEDVNNILRRVKKQENDKIEEMRLSKIRDDLFFSNYKLKKMNGFNWDDFRLGFITVHCECREDIYDFKKKLEKQDWYKYAYVWDDIWEKCSDLNEKACFRMSGDCLTYDELKYFNKDFVYKWKSRLFY